MIIKILNCMPDGTQELMEKEVPEDYFAPAVQENPEEKAAPPVGSDQGTESGERTTK